MSDAEGIAAVVGKMCSNGHEMTPETSKVRPSRHEGRTVTVCLLCLRAADKRYDMRLRLAKAKENEKRGICVNGHDLTVEARTRPDGHRVCRACERASTKAYQQRVKAERNGEPVPSHFGKKKRGVSLSNSRRAFMQQPAYCTSVEEFLRESERKRVIEAKARIGA
jgi:hypothetical protein